MPERDRILPPSPAWPTPARHPNPRHGVARLDLTRILLLLVAATLSACNPGPNQPAKENRQPAASVRTNGFFTETTKPARLQFTHQLADGKLDNIMESDGAGGVILDYNNDGWMDVYLVNSGPAPVLSKAAAGTERWPNRLFRNRRDGTFEDVTPNAGVAGHDFGTTAAAADYDNDGDNDLLAVNFGGLILYRNEGTGTFTEVTAAAGLTREQPAISATFLDADRDGWLDLFVANYLKFDPAVQVPSGVNIPYPGPLSYEPEFNVLYRNRGNGTFEDISEQAGIRIPGHRAMSVAALDYDLDGDQDLYISNDGTANLLLVNDGKGHFRDLGLQAGVALNQFGTADGSMGAAVGDCTGDGLPDILVTRFGKISLYVNSPGGFFEDRIQSSGILDASSAYTSWGGNFIDFDNDGDLDVFIANGHAHFLKGMPPLLFENQGQGLFRDVSTAAGSFFAERLNARGSGAFDYDNDGRPDLVVCTLADRARLLHNRTAQANHWITLKLVGTRSNRDGLGALVRVTAGARSWQAEARCPTSYVFQQDPRLHFGLGSASHIDRIEIRWPSGLSQIVTNLPLDRVHDIREP